MTPRTRLWLRQESLVGADCITEGLAKWAERRWPTRAGFRRLSRRVVRPALWALDRGTCLPSARFSVLEGKARSNGL